MTWPAVIRSQELMASTFQALSMRLMAAKQVDEALSTIEDATRIYRDLVALAPRHLPSLASSLRNIALILLDVGQQDESIIVCKEANKIMDELVENEPYFLPALQEAVGQMDRR
ncbi:hypothetical protein FB451DRAFT_1259458 [Mycena latifolia]|nr:hypothetical protein FB451DRAFT_1259458 [Mycena latifolia]